MGRVPPLIDHRSLQHPTPIQLQYNLCRNMDIPSILCRNRECTSTQGRQTPPNDHRSLQHHYTKSPVSKYGHIQCRWPMLKIQTYPVQMDHVEIWTYPVQMDHVKIQTYPVQMSPLLTPNVQSPTTPNQYNLLRNEEALPC